MSVFKEEKEFKRVIFNVENSLAERLEKAKEQAKTLGKKLDVDSAVDKALEKFLKKAEKKLSDMEQEQKGGRRARAGGSEVAAVDADSQTADAQPGSETESDNNAPENDATGGKSMENADGENMGTALGKPASQKAGGTGGDAKTTNKANAQGDAS